MTKPKTKRSSSMSPIAIQEEADRLAREQAAITKTDPPPPESPKTSDDAPPAPVEIPEEVIAAAVAAELAKHQATPTTDAPQNTVVPRSVPTVVPSVGPNLVGTTVPTGGTNQPYSFGFAGRAGEAREDRITKRKTHPRSVPGELHLRSWSALVAAVRRAADEEAMTPSQWIAQIAEWCLRLRYPQFIAEEYAKECSRLGVANDWHPVYPEEYHHEG